MNRKLQVFRNNEWIDSTMKDLKAGEKFRMFEPEGDPVIFKENSEFLVGADPKEKNGKWSIEIIDPESI